MNLPPPVSPSSFGTGWRVPTDHYSEFALWKQSCKLGVLPLGWGSKLPVVKITPTGAREYSRKDFLHSPPGFDLGHAVWTPELPSCDSESKNWKMVMPRSPERPHDGVAPHAGVRVPFLAPQGLPTTKLGVTLETPQTKQIRDQVKAQ